MKILILKLSAAVTALAVVCSACTTTQQGNPASAGQTDLDDPAAFAGSAAREYRIAPQDTIVVDVFGEENLSLREFKVSNSGEITFPLLGNVKVAGKTRSEVEQMLKQRLGESYLVNPQVTVTVKAYRLRIVSVFGAVNKAGAIELPGEQRWSILDAISQAGGPTPKASKTIEFTRGGVTKKFSFEELKQITDPENTIWVQPGDIITVPESMF
ncbi:MAG: polysaccharide export protein [Verrucomicrobia bacterium]|nr:polysaccharide export protein [Verrucomicrobiota bacterium]MCF7708325.1 polysaccharide export protein [Verrucomicrobiota bacterium]